MHCGGSIAQRRCPQVRPADVVGAIKMLAADVPEEIPYIQQVKCGQCDERASDQIIAGRRKPWPKTN